MCCYWLQPTTSQQTVVSSHSCSPPHGVWSHRVRWCWVETTTTWAAQTVRSVRRPTSTTGLLCALTWRCRTSLATASVAPPGSPCTMAAASAGGSTHTCQTDQCNSEGDYSTRLYHKCQYLIMHKREMLIKKTGKYSWKRKNIVLHSICRFKNCFRLLMCRTCSRWRTREKMRNHLKPNK